MNYLEVYAQVILHSSCGLKVGPTGAEKHKFEDCPDKARYLKTARKHQRKLNSNGIAIGKWINKKKLREALIQSDIGAYKSVLMPGEKTNFEYERAVKEDAEKLYDIL